MTATKWVTVGAVSVNELSGHPATEEWLGAYNSVCIGLCSKCELNMELVNTSCDATLGVIENIPIPQVFGSVKVSNLCCPRETDFDSDDRLTISSLAGFEPMQTDLDSVVSTYWLRPVRFTSDELIQKLPAGALDFKICLSNNFPEKVLMEDHHGLDLVEEEKEQITHQTFKFDPNNLGN
ncbi:hypothetical protein BDR06DRAFT_975458 [Suillus hirtellus]|nr:hypothetical protein BDR06DRAFT_975458 [Suillus hirtellus]